MRTVDEIKSTIKESFGQEFYEGSLIDNFMTAIAQSEVLIYEEIENAKLPYLYSKIMNYTDNLDDLGQMLNLPREDGESDDNYLYRLVNWKLIAESSNATAIQASIINPINASYMEFIPQAFGANTGAVYIIPVNYEDDVISAAIQEAKEKIQKSASAGLYVEYIVPSATSIDYEIKLEVEPEYDLELVRQSIVSALKAYTNNIAPNDYLVVGTLNKIGMSIQGVSYFNVMQVYINDAPVKLNKNLQPIDKKYLLDNISWG